MPETIVSDPSNTEIKVWILKELENAARLPWLARRKLRDWVSDQAALADLELITSELVTNALVHGGGAWVRLSLEVEELGARSYWRVTVADPGRSTSIPMPRMVAPDETSGRGLWLVDEVTNGCWGTETRVGERVVWAMLPLPGRPQDRET
jgi:anti-sigma regulatory factor (Ser/Thr protein kinase)